MTQHDAIDALQWENRRFPPSAEFQRDALVTGTFLYDDASAKLREENTKYLEGDLANYRAAKDVAVR